MKIYRKIPKIALFKGVIFNGLIIGEIIGFQNRLGK